MSTALNGMLIVAMLFAWGMQTGNRGMMWAALAAACAGWVANVLQEYEHKIWLAPAAASVFAVLVGIAQAGF